MLTLTILALALTAQDSPARHVRSTEPRIVTLIEAGIAGSATFRSLIETLNESDVIVYIKPNHTRQALGGYLAHSVVTRGNYRYLSISVQTAGSRRRLVSLLAHELQHAVEVAGAPEARDSESLERLFSGLAIKFGCPSTSCFETRAAKDVEHIVNEEFAIPSPVVRR